MSEYLYPVEHEQQDLVNHPEHYLGKVECAFIGNASKFTNFSEEKKLE